MTVWWKAGIILALLAFQDFVVWHVKDKFDQAAQAEALKAQIEATAEKQKAVEAQAAEAEAALLTERKKTAILNQKWGAYRATNHTDCKLPDGAIGLLEDASSPVRDLPGRPDATVRPAP